MGAVALVASRAVGDPWLENLSLPLCQLWQMGRCKTPPHYLSENLWKILVTPVTIVTNEGMYTPSHLSENLWKVIVTPVTIVTNVEDAEPSHTLKISRNVLWHSLYSWKISKWCLSLSISFWKSLENYCYICDNCDKWGDVKPLPIIFLKIS